MAQTANLSVREVREARQAARVVTSLDRPVGEEEETPLGALLESGERTPEEEVEISLRQDAIRKVVQGLTTPEEVFRSVYLEE